MRLVGLAEKPGEPRSNIAVTGLYMYDNDVVRMAQDLVPSERGELEITDINRIYLEQGRAHLAELGRGFVWLDMGTHDSLLEAGQYVQILEQRQGVRIGCVEEVAYRKGFIDAEECRAAGPRTGRRVRGLPPRPRRRGPRPVPEEPCRTLRHAHRRRTPMTGPRPR